MGEARRFRERRIRDPILRWLVIVGVVVGSLLFIYLVPRSETVNTTWMGLSPNGRYLLSGTFYAVVGIDLLRWSSRNRLGLAWLLQGLLAIVGGSLLLLKAFGFYEVHD
jgi:hypothetical protein